jgi:hypothetical protein
LSAVTELFDEIKKLFSEKEPLADKPPSQEVIDVAQNKYDADVK